MSGRGWGQGLSSELLNDKFVIRVLYTLIDLDRFVYLDKPLSLFHRIILWFAESEVEIAMLLLYAQYELANLPLVVLVHIPASMNNK